MLEQIISIYLTVIFGLALLGLVVGIFSILPKWWAGMIVILVVACMIICFAYSLVTVPALPPYPLGDPYEQHHQDRGTPGG